MGAAADIYRKIIYKKQTTYGTLSGPSGGKTMRREKAEASLKKDTYGSKEVRTDLQKSDLRHGMRSVPGQWGGDLSAGTWSDFIGSFCRRLFAAVTAITGLTITITGSGPTYTIARASGSWLADGVKIGFVGRLTAGGFNAANINKNLYVTGVTALNLTVMTLNGSALVAEPNITAATFTLPGKVTFIPTSGHIEESYDIEDFNPEIPTSAVYTDNKITDIAIDLPSTDIAGFSMSTMGRNIITNTSQYFTSPAAATTTGSMAAVNGLVLVGGAAVAVLTGLNIKCSGSYDSKACVGSNISSAPFANTIEITGSFSAIFDQTTFRDAFINETEIQICAAFSADNSASSDFMSFAMYRVKLTDFQKPSGNGGIVTSSPFTALINNAGGAGTSTEATSFLVQDSAA